MANKTEQVLEATENINNREAFFMKYKKAILIAVAAIIVVIAGVFLYISQISGPREEKASTALSKGQTYFNNEMLWQHRRRQPRQPLCRSLLRQPRQMGRSSEEPRRFLNRRRPDDQPSFSGCSRRRIRSPQPARQGC